MIPLPYPPVLTGTAEQQLRQLWDYVYQLVERLNAKSEFAASQQIPK